MNSSEVGAVLVVHPPVSDDEAEHAARVQEMRRPVSMKPTKMSLRPRIVGHARR